ncbi:hypothetical protein [Deinococcus marmoris]|uniref:Uncharacterized protein n=1 Tax=Deinococcus marmoris TaxID=249408 RepID=A0A1U7NZE2_9DEIO|nr:hypothetical protein [Deinococcus marmoris]OLV18291.1 hypothetical protein BOO71_0005968 [Deinococcus marmoris]
MRPLLPLLLVTCCGWAGGLAQSPAPLPPSPIQPGQVWTLSGTTAEGELFQTTLRLSVQPPAGTPATYRADRGVLLLDQKNSSLIALDFADAQDGGLALACAYIGPLQGKVFKGVLAAAPLDNLPPLLEAALAIFKVATTPADRAEASAELKLGHCTLSLEP